MQYEFGMVGLGVMGRNLLLNMADHGFAVAGLDTDPTKVAALHAEGEGKQVQGFTDAKEFVASLRKPRPIMMLVPAGAAVDSVINSLRPFLEEGDLMIDGGNSFYKDTDRRYKELGAAKIGFLGIGVSGGESGARHGPSMMAGGPADSYKRVQPVLEAVAAQADGEPCVKLLGAGAAGHYVKMVHNGIEYGLMQIIAEVYDLLHRGAGRDNEQIAQLFDKWNAMPIGGFLIQITSEVLRKKEGNKYLVDLVQDAARQKGTGKWTSQDSMELHVPTPTVDAAVSARDLSTMKAEREALSAALGSWTKPVDQNGLDDALTQAMQTAIVVTYAQGFEMLHGASEAYGFGVNLADAASVWRAGCIIRSGLLGDFTRAFRGNAALSNILLDPTIGKLAVAGRAGLREVICRATAAGIPAPALSASLAYLDGCASPRLPANLIQGLRDYFGAHTYERIDEPGTFHTSWGS